MLEITLLIVAVIIILSGFFAYEKVRELFRENLIPQDLITLHIKVLKHNQTEGPGDAAYSAEQLFASLHGLLNTTDSKASEIMSFEILSSDDGIDFYITIPEEIKSFVESQVYANYPGTQIEVVNDPLDDFDKGNSHLFNLNLEKKNYYPIKTYKDFESDTLNALSEALSEVRGEDRILMQYALRPISDNWQKQGHKYIAQVKGIESPGLDFSPGGLFIKVIEFLFKDVLSALISGPASKESREQKESKKEQDVKIDHIENKLSKMGYRVELKCLVNTKDNNKAEKYLRSIRGSFKQLTASNFNSINLGSLRKSGVEAFNEVKTRKMGLGDDFVFNTEELGTVYHFPGSSVQAPNISRSRFKKVEAPNNLPISGDVTYFGETNFRDKKVKFGIKNNVDRLRHMYFVGKTGVGKSTLFENMIVQDIKDGRGCGLVDPHGETINNILRRIPKDRMEDVVLIDPSNADNPPAINVLECPDPSQANLLASSVLTAFKLQFGYSWGPRLEYILNYAILTLVQIEGTTLLSINRLLTDKNYRKYIVERVDDPVIERFWEEEYAELEQAYGAEAISSIQNKVNRLLSSTTIRNILGQRNSSINLDKVMNEKKILLVNLSKGQIGDDNANLLGSLLVNRLTFYAMQRARMNEKDRVPFYLFVDEFQNFATESFVTILSEARKYGLSLHLTHQYTAQLPESIKDAILGNVGSLIAFTLGVQDASLLGPEFSPTFDENDLISLEKYNMYVKLHIDGSTTQPFSAKSLPPVYNEGEDYSEEIKNMSAEKYGNDRDYVERKIKIWMDRPFDLGMAIAQKYRQKKESDNE